MVPKQVVTVTTVNKNRPPVPLSPSGKKDEQQLLNLSQKLQMTKDNVSSEAENMVYTATEVHILTTFLLLIFPSLNIENKQKYFGYYISKNSFFSRLYIILSCETFSRPPNLKCILVLEWEYAKYCMTLWNLWGPMMLTEINLIHVGLSKKSFIF